MSTRGRARGPVAVVATLLIASQLVWTPSVARAAPWDEPITAASSELPSPEQASLSADGRYVEMSNFYDYRPRVFDRATEVLGDPLLPFGSGAVVVPDGSSLIVISSLSAMSEGMLGGRNELWRHPLTAGPADLLTGGIDPTLSIVLDSTSFDGRLLAVELAPAGDVFPNVRSRVAILDTHDGSLDFVDSIIPGADLRTSAASMSSDGRYVTVWSQVGNCYPNCSYASYVVDRTARTYQRIDVGIGGADPDASSFSPEVSGDGRHVLFLSKATNLVSGVVGVQNRLYVRDLDTSTTELISDAPRDPIPRQEGISSDGQRVVYLADAPTDSSAPYPAPQVFVYDRTEGASHEISVGLSGDLPNNYTDWAKITEDGRTVVFRSEASNLVLGTSAPRTIYVRGPAISAPSPPPAPPIGSGVGSLVPARLLESRSGVGLVTVDRQFEGIGVRSAGSVTEVQVAGRGGVPVDAAAAMLNVTAVDARGDGFLTVFPCGVGPPLASSVNYRVGGTVPNVVLTKVGASGRVCVYTSAAVDLVIDVNAYVAAGSGVGSLVPARLLESRSGVGLVTVDRQFEGIGVRSAGSVTEVQVAGRGGVPVDAAAAMLNVTAVDARGDGFLTVFPCGVGPPLASSVNYRVGGTVPNAVLTKVGASGRVCVYTSAAVDLVIDVNAYVAAGSGVGSLVPARLLESRSGVGLVTVDRQFEGIGVRSAGSVTEVQVAGRGGVPVDAAAAMLNVTAVDARGDGFLTVFPCGVGPPLASSVNYRVGGTVPNAVLTKVGASGRVCVYTSAAVDLVIDVNAYVQ